MTTGVRSRFAAATLSEAWPRCHRHVVDGGAGASTVEAGAVGGVRTRSTGRLPDDP
jgi:hypothetical protein